MLLPWGFVSRVALQRSALAHRLQSGDNKTLRNLPQIYISSVFWRCQSPPTCARRTHTNTRTHTYTYTQSWDPTMPVAHLCTLCYLFLCRDTGELCGARSYKS
jgi:hypothetical protein